MKTMEMCRKWLPSFIDISFLLRGVEMCVFLILNVVMVTGLLGCCFLHPTKAAALAVRWSGCLWVQFEAGDGGISPSTQPTSGWEQPNLEQGFLRTDFSPRKNGNYVTALIQMPTR